MPEAIYSQGREAGSRREQNKEKLFSVLSNSYENQSIITTSNSTPVRAGHHPQTCITYRVTDRSLMIFQDFLHLFNRKNATSSTMNDPVTICTHDS